MKIAVTSRGSDLDSEVDPRFGRAAYILIVDTETFDFKAFDNRENVDALKGAGIQAARSVSDSGAEVLVTGFCGPNAFKALSAVGIKVANNAGGTVRNAAKAYMEGKLTMADKANAEGHW